VACKHQKLIKIPCRRDITLIRNKSIYNDKKLGKLTLENNFRSMANTLACVQQTPRPSEILRGGEGKAAHRLPITLHMRSEKECSWTLPGAFSSPEPLGFNSNRNHEAKRNDGLWGREWSRYCKLDD